MSHLFTHAILGLRLHQAVEQIRQADEVNTEAVTNGFHAQGDRQVRFAYSGRPKKQGVLVTLQETQTRQFADLLLVDGGRELEVKLLQPLDVRKASQLRAHLDVPLLPGVGLALQNLLQKNLPYCDFLEQVLE